eukprot:212200_1
MRNERISLWVIITIFAIQSSGVSGALNIYIQSCSDWTDATVSGSFLLKLSGVNATSAYFTLNPNTVLPINGGDTGIVVDDIGVDPASLGDILSVSVAVNHKNGYCLKELNIDTQKEVVRLGADYIG